MTATRFAAGGAILATAATVWGLWAYPLLSWPLALALVAYGMTLWRWPAAFLVVLPIVLPALDLGMWTGWMVVTEADLFILISLAVLLVRAPLNRTDLLPGGLPGGVLSLLIVATAISTIIGLTAAFGFDGRSDNPFLRPDNALRLAKGLVEALVLLPFLRQRQRTHADASGWLACGIAAGLVAATLAVLAERLLFAGILDFRTDYRVAGPFSSMHVGGGHIGAYVALALPFALALFGPAKRLPLGRLPLGFLAGVGGAYTLVVTFARTAYAAGLAGCAVTGFLLLVARRRRGGTARLVAVAPLVLLVLAVAAAASSGVMRHRLAIAATDLLTREANWRAGWAVRDHGALASTFGMGLGTYQRAMLSRSSIDRPSDFGLERDDAGPFAWVRVETPFYLGQKVTLPPSNAVHLTLRFRGGTARAVLAWSLCDKVLLYSDNCRGGQVAAATPGAWQSVSATLPIAGLGAPALGGLIHRPVELSVFGPVLGTGIAIRDIRLTDDAGLQLLANGDFRQGMDRWLFTDDSHVSWRILDQYLMLLFETGIVGLAAYLALAGLALAGGVRAALHGDPIGAAVTGSVVSFLISGLFDNVLEAPRVATLFFLVCLLGLLKWELPKRG
jgi:hypothetical protein